MMYTQNEKKKTPTIKQKPSQTFEWYRPLIKALCFTIIKAVGQ